MCQYNQRKMVFPIITNEIRGLPFYVTGVGSLENQHPAVRPHGLRDYQILYITAGRGYLQVDGDEYEIGPHMGFYFMPEVPHEYYAMEEPWTSWWVTFNGYALDRFKIIANYGRYSVFHIYDMDRINLLHYDIHASASSSGLSAANDASCHLYRFLLDMAICTGTEAQGAKHTIDNRLKPLLTYIEENFSKDIALNDMAGITGISPQHLCRLFKQAFNMRPFEYLTKFRLRKAKELLLSPDNPALRDVASKTGFNDVSYFGHIFRKHEGMTPMQFRRMYRKY